MKEVRECDFDCDVDKSLDNVTVHDLVDETVEDVESVTVSDELRDGEDIERDKDFVLLNEGVELTEKDEYVVVNEYDTAGE